MGLLLWAATLAIVYGTLTLPFAVHLLLIFVWLVMSGLTFVWLSRTSLKETESIYESSLNQVIVAQEDVVLQMATYSEARDALTGEHLHRVRLIATGLAVALGIAPEDAKNIGKAAIAHDLGKIGVPDAILGKPSRLTDDEYDLIKEHTLIGERVLGTSPLFCLERECARHHHEWWDGSGYPDGLSGADIPLVARITSVADVYDALITRRPYKEPWPVEQAIEYIRQRAGSQFDPAVVSAFLRLDQAGQLPSSPEEENEPSSVRSDIGITTLGQAWLKASVDDGSSRST
jgi:HD-GYP domain-containing protein (c-di-GMP phosphodiesterase class II)